MRLLLRFPYTGRHERYFLCAVYLARIHACMRGYVLDTSWLRFCVVSRTPIIGEARTCTGNVCLYISDIRRWDVLIWVKYRFWLCINWFQYTFHVAGEKPRDCEVQVSHPFIRARTRLASSILCFFSLFPLSFAKRCRRGSVATPEPQQQSCAFICAGVRALYLLKFLVHISTVFDERKVVMGCVGGNRYFGWRRSWWRYPSVPVESLSISMIQPGIS